MADEAPFGRSRSSQAIADKRGGIPGFRRTGDFWDVYVVHVAVFRDRPPYRSVFCIDVGGTIHLIPEERFREIVEDSRFFHPLLAPGAVYEGVTVGPGNPRVGVVGHVESDRRPVPWCTRRDATLLGPGRQRWGIRSLETASSRSSANASALRVRMYVDTAS